MSLIFARLKLMTIEEIRKGAPDGAVYWARLYDAIEYLRCENDIWYWWNGSNWLYCKTITVKQLDLVVL